MYKMFPWYMCLILNSFLVCIGVFFIGLMIEVKVVCLPSKVVEEYASYERTVMIRLLVHL